MHARLQGNGKSPLWYICTPHACHCLLSATRTQFSTHLAGHGQRQLQDTQSKLDASNVRIVIYIALDSPQPPGRVQLSDSASKSRSSLPSSSSASSFSSSSPPPALVGLPPPSSASCALSIPQQAMASLIAERRQCNGKPAYEQRGSFVCVPMLRGPSCGSKPRPLQTHPPAG